MTGLYRQNVDIYPICIREPEGTVEPCLAPQSDPHHPPPMNAFSAFGAGTIIDVRNGSPSPPADVRSDPRIPENRGGIGHLRLQEITVFPQLQRLSPAPTSGHRVPVSRHSARACARA